MNWQCGVAYVLVLAQHVLMDCTFQVVNMCQMILRSARQQFPSQLAWLRRASLFPSWVVSTICLVWPWLDLKTRSWWVKPFWDWTGPPMWLWLPLTYYGFKSWHHNLNPNRKPVGSYVRINIKEYKYIVMYWNKYKKKIKRVGRVVDKSWWPKRRGAKNLKLNHGGSVSGMLCLLTMVGVGGC